MAGEVVPVEITVNLIKTAMKRNGWSEKKYLIDGFPRNMENQQGWERVMGDEVDLKFLLFLECSEEVMIQRIQRRAD